MEIRSENVVRKADWAKQRLCICSLLSRPGKTERISLQQSERIKKRRKEWNRK